MGWGAGGAAWSPHRSELRGWARPRPALETTGRGGGSCGVGIGPPAQTGCGGLRMAHGSACPPDLPECPPGWHTPGEAGGPPGRGSRGSTCRAAFLVPSSTRRRVPAGAPQPSAVTAHVGSPARLLPSRTPAQPPPPTPRAPPAQDKASGGPRGLAESRLPHGCAQGSRLRHSTLSEVHETLQGARRRRRVQGCGGPARGQQTQSRCPTYSPAGPAPTSPEGGDPSSSQVRSGAA